MSGIEIPAWADQWLAAGGWMDPFGAFVAAFVFGQMLAWTYEFTFQGLSYSRSFSHAIVLVCVSAAILVQAMQHSWLAGLGLFGILSMIRFRTDLKTPRDLVYVMGAACVGVACGVAAIAVATLGAVMFSLISLYLHLGPFGSRVRFDGVLRFRTESGGDNHGKLERLFRRHCLRQVLLSVGESNGTREHVYQVKFIHQRNREQLLAALREEFNAEDARLMLQDATAEY
jgi:hypothetical protein